ncbi:MAG: hypothetical protein ACRBFS_24035 [Aureispira sp.]
MKGILHSCFLFFLLLTSCFTSKNIVGQAIGDSSFKIVKVHYQSTDTIEIVTNFDSTKLRPTLLFLQGSLPRPLVIDYDSMRLGFTLLSNFNPKQLIDSFNIVFISHPYIPSVANYKDITPNALYVPDLKNGHCFDLNYQNSNTLEYHTSRVKFGMDYMKQVYSFSEYSVLGHSQGAVVASKLCAVDSSIAKTVLLSLNPMGRYYTEALYNKEQLTKGNKKFSEYMATKVRIKSDLSGDQEEIDTVHCTGDLPKTRLSYSVPVFKDLAKTPSELYIGIGELDINSYFTEFLEIHLMMHSKYNFTSKIYPNVEHNFSPILDSGRVDYNNSQWQNVIDDSIKWLLDEI